MKRSEMLLKLMEILVEAPQEIESAAHSILTRLEKAGMCPPINKEKSFKLLDNGALTYGVHEWEPEDEKV